MKVLVAGGAGYIGSCNVAYLLTKGVEVLVLDDLSSGYAEAVSGAALIKGNIGDKELLDRIFSEHHIDAVMNFASFIEVSESIRDPAKYYINNVAHTLSLLEAMVRNDVTRFVFSSTAAIFGNPRYKLIDELHPREPINPYGKTKLVIEEALKDFAFSYGLRSVCLRYFNAAGADLDSGLGERHDPETHLIPLVLQAASGRREKVTIFGDDYDTADGTCVRDYIHVIDLAQAHWLALIHLMDGGGSDAFNLGNGEGYSIRQVIDSAQRVTSRAFQVDVGGRRPGDPSVLVADSKKAKSVLGWDPKFSDLDIIISHAWEWELQKGVRW